MKIKNLFEASNPWAHIPEDVVSWLKLHLKNFDLKNASHFSFENGELNLNKDSRAVFGGISDEDIPEWKFGSVGEIEFDNTNSFTKFDFLPYRCDYNLQFDFKMSLKGIYKRVTECNIFYISKETTSGLLDLLRIKNIRGGILVSGGTASIDPDFKKAFLLVKFGFEDGDDILEVQDRFIDAGLERFL